MPPSHQVSGHADAITGVKFSPDGRHLLSIGGDGCILVWKVPPSLVGAMQDRLLEMYTAAQKRLKVARGAATAGETVTKKEPNPEIDDAVNLVSSSDRSSVSARDSGIVRSVENALPVPPEAPSQAKGGKYFIRSAPT